MLISSKCDVGMTACVQVSLPPLDWLSLHMSGIYLCKIEMDKRKTDVNKNYNYLYHVCNGSVRKVF